MGEYVLEMNKITKVFPGVTALDGVTLKVRPGTVHALMGENGAGKSTLMKCLFGIYHEDGGEIILDGKKEVINTSKQALDLGVSMIHQELHPIRFRPVMENIWLGRFPMRGIAVDRKKMIQMTKDLFKKVDLDIDPEIRAGELSASTLQLVEIARAVSYNSKIIIMDEPTSSLTDNETEHLFKIINQLRDEGRSIIYISHKMEEILRIADEVTIMRDGQYVGTWPAAELTTDLIISRMVGRDMTNRFPPKDYEPFPRETVLRVKDLCSPLPKSFQDVSFHLHRGEILGIGGLVGAQRTELVEAIFGLREIASGIIEKNGKAFHVKNVRDAKAAKIALLTEERRATGVFGSLSVLDNTVIASQQKYAKHGVLQEKKRYQAASEADKQLNVKTPTLETAMQNLSGGNQQKVLIARWLLTDPDILILDEPTRGIDVGAKYEIYTIMLDLVKAGKSIIMISSEMPELLGMADRVMVMCEGRVTGFLEKDQFDQVEVMRLATQFMK
ncbi:MULTISPECIES: sugar ABC transporter ATP-binding protein [Anaerotruncus]|uniref:Ribose/galactose/methyl galactoside import ATP-binding protein n=2 Tax=Anaerotruncus TaxID=244127 RepID=A0A498CQ54_9FIRM|nr:MULTISPECIES: sugar ABC transporter ATP-binding protein [Anaerotruncus]MBC3937797.1 sugar ABC transporter ATP-binding protein [Anaerotruncus massiliensis (ex Togo et al. 2019)]MCQ4894698.1 sugar ABC transporter ATP-binding protein [Anaerotruncus sp. DFI.9.16]RLL13795.1 sugar ABC transporter ATP-binding protein [Anaerotruncus massiliensis (ex Liu et al. 2021)]